MLALLAEANLTGGEMPGDAIARAGAALDAARAERNSTSTQENDWMTLAAEALAEQASLAQFTVDGAAGQGRAQPPLERRLRSLDKPIDDRQYRPEHGPARHQRAPARRSRPSPPPRTAMRSSARSTSSTERRTDLQSIAQNERIVVVLKVTETEARYARLLIVDRLPAGLEIDNPALFDSGSIDAFSWLKNDVPTHTEYRDDRFVAAFDRAPGQSAFFNLAYVVARVAPGRYVYPPATAEDMYAPERFGRTAFGAIEVTAK